MLLLLVLSLQTMYRTLIHKFIFPKKLPSFKWKIAGTLDEGQLAPDQSVGMNKSMKLLPLIERCSKHWITVHNVVAIKLSLFLLDHGSNSLYSRFTYLLVLGAFSSIKWSLEAGEVCLAVNLTTKAELQTSTDPWPMSKLHHLKRSMWYDWKFHNEWVNGRWNEIVLSINFI